MPHWEQAAEERNEWLSDLRRRLGDRLHRRVGVNRRNARRAAQWLEDPRCWFCGRETRWITPAGGARPDDAATTDHLYPHGHPEHGRHARSTVLACHGCNHQRGEEWDQHGLTKPCIWPGCWEPRPHEHEPRTATELGPVTRLWEGTFEGTREVAALPWRPR